MTVEGIVKLTRHECDLDDDGHDQAEHVVYDPTASGLGETDVQGAIDVLAALGSIPNGVTVQDEGTPLATAGTTLNFVGPGVTASGTGATKTITVPTQRTFTFFGG